MMKEIYMNHLSNKYNLPQPLVSALEKDDYDIGDADISVTSLWKPSQMVKLAKAHAGEIQRDAADYLMNLLGSAFHRLMEEADVEATVEKRLFATVGGVTISGKFDRLLVDRQILQDYKVTSVPRFRRQLTEPDWENQLNTYAWLLRLHGMEVRALQVIVMLRDWVKNQADRDASYPNLPLQVVDVPLWDPALAEERIAARVAYFLQDNECNDIERWYRPPAYAVMKEGRKNAVKLFATEADATAFISYQSDKGKLHVQHRPGSNIRCQEYCEAAPWCPQWRQIDPTGGGSNPSDG
jgi:hypothetical protein